MLDYIWVKLSGLPGVRIIEVPLNSFVNLTTLCSVYFYYTGKLTRLGGQ